MKLLEDKIDRFQKKISTYDRTNWQIIVENYILKSNIYEYEKKNNKSDRRQLIDIDLFRGKPFQKAKPLYGWSIVSLKALFRILFYPFCLRWWIEHTDLISSILLLIVYFMEVFIILIYFLSTVARQTFSYMEVFSIHFITVCVGEIYIHVISKNLTRPNQPPKLRTSPSVSEYTKIVDQRSLSVENMDLLGVKPVSYSNSTRRRAKTRKSVDDIDKCFDSDNAVIITKDPPTYKSSRNSLKVFDDDPSFNTVEISEQSSHITHSSSSLSETEQKQSEFTVTEQPDEIEKGFVNSKGHIQEEVMVTFFEDSGPKKLKISIYDIVRIIEDRVNNINIDFFHFYILFVICVFYALLPCLFKVYSFWTNGKTDNITSRFSDIYPVTTQWFNSSPKIVTMELFLIVCTRFIIIGAYMFLVVVAEKTYRIRFLYAKYFGALTSSRRAKRNRLPHFRLHKVRNIKAWLSLRSYLRRCGPLRSIDIVVAFTFYLSLVFITFVCFKILFDINYPNSDNTFLSDYFDWEIPAWAILLSSLLLRFFSLGSEVNRKYNNVSELLTEQINLYLHMEVCPQKKEEFIIANNVLKLASKLIKEIESPHKVTSFIMNPLLRNITRVIILSLISGVLSEIFGVTFKFWKIKTS